MKTTLKLIIFLCLLNTTSLKAQQNHFIYIESESSQPFYLKLNGRTLNSSGSGYLIVPRLTEGAYNFIIGFPNKQWPQQNVSLQVANKDAGYSLKNFGDQGWGLVNIQTLETFIGTQNTNVPNAEIVEEPSQMQDNSFAGVLSTVINTPLVLPNKRDSLITLQINLLKTIEASTGKQLIYVDKTTNGTDTISIILPSPKEEESIPESTPIAIEETSTVVVADSEVNSPSINTDTVVAPPPVIKDNSTESLIKAGEGSTVEIKTDAIPAVTTDSISNPTLKKNCINIATDNDFLKLRKKMAAEGSDESMIEVAKKNYKTKCYSTDQIKNLSVLFLKDEWKYKFFDESYQFTSDAENFKTLQSQLSDVYFIGRFQAMLQK